MKLFIVWSDKSDAGKDTVAELLSELVPLTIVKFSRAFKTPLEDWLGLDRGSLDDKEFRIKPVVNPVTGNLESFTYNDLMYNFFHVFKSLYPSGNYLVPGATKNVINSIIGNVAIVDCRVDCRNQTELELLKLLEYELVLLHVDGRGETKSTDLDIKLDDWSFVPTQYYIDNSGTMAELRDKVRKIVEDLYE
jgi:hypothetical protein